MGWWRASSEDAERWFGPEDTKDAAIKAGRDEDFAGGEPFVVMEAERQEWRFDCFDSLDEEFDNANEELADVDGDPASINAGIGSMKVGVNPDLKRHLETALEQWVRQHGNVTAWALHFSGPVFSVPAASEWHAAFQSGEVD